VIESPNASTPSRQASLRGSVMGRHGNAHEVAGFAPAVRRRRDL
jgi:hypothetical protein